MYTRDFPAAVSGTNYLAVTPWGDFYPCHLHQFVGNEEFLLGNVDEGVKRTDITSEFKQCNVYAKKECKDCFAGILLQQRLCNKLL